VTEFYGVMTSYLDDAYGEVEKALDLDGRHANGFAKSSYHQRLVSSLHACRVSLTRRLNRIEAVVAGLEDAIGPEEDPDEDEEAPDTPARATANTDWRAVERAASIERTYLRDLLDRLSALEVEDQLVDPKMRALVDVLRDRLPHDAVLVFSRYTDTLEACLRVFERSWSPAERPGFALYTGGDVWIDTDGTRARASKKGVTDALDDGAVRIVFCSEAASEGLNLQTARVLVNVDVPWNPARLEQRIGRIARLGQTAAEVLIYNLWYPDSIEARIYRRLLARRELYQLAVGQFPELVSRSIRDSVASRFDRSLELRGVDPLAELQRLRGEVQHRAIQRIWDVGSEAVPISEELRSRLRDALTRLVGGRRLQGLTVEAGSRRPLTLQHEVLQAFDQVDVAARGDVSERELVVIDEGEVPVAFGVMDGSEIAVVSATELHRLLLSAIGADALQLNGSPRLDLADLDRSAGLVRGSSRWLPDHDERRTLSEIETDAPAGQLRVRRLGTVTVSATRP
jgi:hypothetical protein